MVQNAKAALRKRLLAARPHDSAGLTEQLVKVLEETSPQRLASFIPLAGEPQIGEFNNLAAKDLDIFFPKINSDELVFASGELHPGPLGIMEPQGPETKELDIVLVPALAVDLAGNRLGRGKGFYDRTLGKFPAARKLAVVFDSEVLEYVPTDHWDEKLHGVVTPSRTIWFD